MKERHVATETGGRSDRVRVVAVLLLALAAVGAAAAGGAAGQRSPVPTTPPPPSVPAWCEARAADLCGRWDQPPLDPG